MQRVAVLWGIVALSIAGNAQTRLSTPEVGAVQECVPGTNCQQIPQPASPAQCAAGSYCSDTQAGSAEGLSPTQTPLGGSPALRPERQLQIQNLKPEPPTEFQQFIATALGESLPIFGANLFTNVPSTFAPVDHVPVSADYVLGPGDELLIRAWGQINLDSNVTVDRSGNIYLPKVGTLSVAGLKYQQIEGYLRSAIGRVFRNFDLSVDLGRLRSIQIFVVGQARKPGSYTVSSLSTLVNAIFASGGPSVSGSMRNIQLKRGNQVVTDFDLYDLLLSGDKSKDARLLPGDVIYVAPVGPRIALSGSVHNPAIYELKGATTLQDVLQMSGGITSTASTGKAFIERINDRTVRGVLEVSLRDFGAQLQDGDLVRIMPISPRFEDVVTLRGNVAQPGRYPWHLGMRVSDLIPSREFLIPRRFWRQQNALVGRGSQLSRKQGMSVQAGTQAISPEEDVSGEAGENNQSPPVGQAIIRNDINWDYAVIQRISPDDLSTKLLTFNLGIAIQDPKSESNQMLQAGDVITIFSQSDIAVPAEKRSKFVELGGEVRAPGLYRVETGERLRQIVARAGGLTPNAYLLGAVFSRESVRAEQQKRLDQYIDELQRELERSSLNANAAALNPEEIAALSARAESQRQLIAKLREARATGRVVLEVTLTSTENGIDALPNLALEDGDSLLIPARPATIDVVGAVYNPASFVEIKTKRVKDYVQQAGGPTRGADSKRMFIIGPDGAVLSRAIGRGHLADLHLWPGSTIIVPEQLEKGSTLRGIRDWSQVFSEFALGAAAIKVLSP